MVNIEKQQIGESAHICQRWASQNTQDKNNVGLNPDTSD